MQKVLTLIILAFLAVNSVAANNGKAEAGQIDAFSYLVLAEPFDIWLDKDINALNDFLKSLKVPKNAAAETILQVVKNSKFIQKAYFLELVNNNVDLNCVRIKRHGKKVGDLYGLRRKRSDTIEPFLMVYGARAYGYCARKFNDEFEANAKPFPGESELDLMVAFGTEPELKLEQCDTLSQDERLERAKQVDLTSYKTKVHRMLQATYTMIGFPDKPVYPSEGADSLYDYVIGQCKSLSDSYGLELDVLSLAYAFKGDSLAEFQPRLLKLREYQRICNARFDRSEAVEKAFEKVLFEGGKKLQFGIILRRTKS